MIFFEIISQTDEGHCMNTSVSPGCLMTTWHFQSSNSARANCHRHQSCRLYHVCSCHRSLRSSGGSGGFGGILASMAVQKPNNFLPSQILLYQGSCSCTEAAFIGACYTNKVKIVRSKTWDYDQVAVDIIICAYDLNSILRMLPVVCSIHVCHASRERIVQQSSLEKVVVASLAETVINDVE
jgi:hypothetical protein